MPGPSKEVLRHLDEAELIKAINEAQKEGQTRLIRRLCFIRNLYKGDSVTEAADRVGVAQPTGSRWIEAWNAEGIDGLKPDFGGGRPSELSEEQKQQLEAVLKENQRLTTRQIQQLVEEGFNVSYSQRHVSRLIKNMNYETESQEESDHPAGAGEIPAGNLQAAIDKLDEEVVTESGL